jgi:hypothetical protein
LEAFGQELPIAATAVKLNSCDPLWDEHFTSGVDADQIANSELKLSWKV